jgi:hypothetical protein
LKTNGEWRYSSTILDVDTRWRREVSFMRHQPYSQRNDPEYPLARRLDGAQSRSGCCGEEKNLVLAGIGTRPSNPYPVATSIKLPKLFICVAAILNVIIRFFGAAC